MGVGRGGRGSRVMSYDSAATPPAQGTHHTEDFTDTHTHTHVRTHIR